MAHPKRYTELVMVNVTPEMKREIEDHAQTLNQRGPKTNNNRSDAARDLFAIALRGVRRRKARCKDERSNP